MSTITSDGGDVDFLCSSQPHDNLAEMMTSKEVSQSGTVRVVRNIESFANKISLYVKHQRHTFALTNIHNRLSKTSTYKLVASVHKFNFSTVEKT